MTAKTALFVQKDMWILKWFIKNRRKIVNHYFLFIKIIFFNLKKMKE